MQDVSLFEPLLKVHFRQIRDYNIFINKLSFKNSFLGFLISAIVANLLVYASRLLPDNNVIAAIAALSILAFDIWLTVFVLKKITGIRMDFGSAVFYVIGVAIIVAIIFIPIAALLAFQDSLTAGSSPLFAATSTLVYALLAGYLFFKKYKTNDESESSEKQGE